MKEVNLKQKQILFTVICMYVLTKSQDEQSSSLIQILENTWTLVLVLL